MIILVMNLDSSSFECYPYGESSNTYEY